MSDLASPLLVTMGEESHAYICFAALMSRSGHSGGNLVHDIVDRGKCGTEGVVKFGKGTVKVKSGWKITE